MLRQILLFLCLACLLPFAAKANETFIPRTLIALYDSREQDDIRLLNIHSFFEMPANWLGFDVHYYDVRQPLPELGDDVHGIIIGFDTDPQIGKTEYLDWLYKAIKDGKRLVQIGDIGIFQIDELDDAALRKLNYIESRIGVRDENVWHPLTHKSVVVYKNKEMVDFERKVVPPLPAFAKTTVVKGGTSHLRVALDESEPNNYADLVVTGPQGGYVAAGYAFHEQTLQDRYVTAWYINPFTFLREALVDEPFPVPDVTTRAGRRIFYSHIDGDGWNNLSLMEEYQETLASPADVLEEKILEPYNDFGFSVGLVAADVAKNCFGNEKNRASARSILAQPNVEATSHTYTHPLYWQFFKDYTLEKEAKYASAYPKKAGMFAQDFSSLIGSSQKRDRENPAASDKPYNKMTEEERMRELYDTPRSYNCVPFDEDNEITGANQVIEALAPEGTVIELIQWSGNTSPYEQFLRKTREAGMLNINGGESRFDNEYPSYSSLYPIGVKIGEERQIYSTASNENTYTNLWSERYFGYRYLIETVRHTEEPIRISPFNVYFHSYSGERPASLKALIEIMDYARDHELLPLFTSDFARIAGGFFTTQLEKLGEHYWRVHHRGHLQTLRFDNADDLRVDFNDSIGVLGERIHQGNLYIFLNPSLDKAEIMLKKIPQIKNPTNFALVSSRWDIIGANTEADSAIHVVAKGFGKGKMQWKVPVEGDYIITAKPEHGESQTIRATSEKHEIAFELAKTQSVMPVEIVISHVEAAD